MASPSARGGLTRQSAPALAECFLAVTRAALQQSLIRALRARAQLHALPVLLPGGRVRVRHARAEEFAHGARHLVRAIRHSHHGDRDDVVPRRLYDHQQVRRAVQRLPGEKAREGERRRASSSVSCKSEASRTEASHSERVAHVSVVLAGRCAPRASCTDRHEWTVQRVLDLMSTV